MRGRTAEAGRGQHLLKLVQREGISCGRSGQHGQGEAGREWRRNAILVWHHLEHDDAATFVQRRSGFSQQRHVAIAIKMALVTATRILSELLHLPAFRIECNTTIVVGTAGMQKKPHKTKKKKLPTPAGAAVT